MDDEKGFYGWALRDANDANDADDGNDVDYV